MEEGVRQASSGTEGIRQASSGPEGIRTASSIPESQLKVRHNTSGPDSIRHNTSGPDSIRHNTSGAPSGQDGRQDGARNNPSSGPDPLSPTPPGDSSSPVSKCIWTLQNFKSAALASLASFQCQIEEQVIVTERRLCRELEEVGHLDVSSIRDPSPAVTLRSEQVRQSVELHHMMWDANPRHVQVMAMPSHGSDPDSLADSGQETDVATNHDTYSSRNNRKRRIVLSRTRSDAHIPRRRTTPPPGMPGPAAPQINYRGSSHGLLPMIVSGHPSEMVPVRPARGLLRQSTMSDTLMVIADEGPDKPDAMLAAADHRDAVREQHKAQPRPAKEAPGDCESQQEQPYFELNPVWNAARKGYVGDRLTQALGSSRAVASKDRMLESLRPGAGGGSGASFGFEGRRHRWTISPFSKGFMAWNMLFALVLGYELMVFPLGTFELPEEGFLKYMQWFTAIFWTFDIMMSCLSGYMDANGRVVRDQYQILKQYCRTWMVPDAILITLQWTTLAEISADWTGAADSLRLGKSARYMRVLRLARLLRLRRLTEAMHSLDDLMNSQACTIGKSIIVNLLMILVIAHFVACLWYYIGTTNIDGQDSWVSVYGFDPVDWEYIYWVSLHWSMTQFTPGSVAVQPQNARESCYSVVVLVLGLIIFSSIIGGITTATNNLKNMNAWYGKQIWLLRKFFREKQIPLDLLARVTRFADAVVQPKQSQVSIDDVKLLNLLPESMRMEVLLQLYRPVLERHPFFCIFMNRSQMVMKKVCQFALTELVLDLDDVLFTAGQIAYCMYFVRTGKLKYEINHFDIHQHWPIEDEHGISCHWCCEAVLWTSWTHQGEMTALSENELIALTADTFQQVVLQHKADAVDARKYGQRFVEKMNRIFGSTSEQVLSDLLEAGSMRESASSAVIDPLDDDNVSDHDLVDDFSL